MLSPTSDTTQPSTKEYSFNIVVVDPCRICNSLETNLNILTDELGDEGVLLHEALEFITCLKVDTDDGLSQSLCAPCNTRLLDAFRFKNQALDACKGFYDLDSQTKVMKIFSIDEDEVQLEMSADADDISTADTDAHVEGNEESSKKLEIDKSTDAVSFLIEHQPENTKQKETPTKPDGKDWIAESIKQNPRTTYGKHECQVCGRKFFRRSNLIDHLRLHANVKKFACTYCDKTFVQVANYRTHLRIHTKERPFKCSLCQKAYNQSGSLKIHIRSHTKERNYTCTCCEKKFTNSTDLRKHLRTHDPSQQFKCEYCEKLFAQRGNMKSHQRRYHLNKISD